MPIIRPKHSASRPPAPETPSSKPSPSPDGQTAAGLTAAEEPKGTHHLIQMIGKGIAHAHLYGPAHSVAAASAEQAFNALDSLLVERKTLTLTVSDGALFVDGESLEMKNPLMGTFAQALASLDTSTIVLEQGMTRDEFTAFTTILVRGKAQAGRNPSDTGADDASADKAPSLDDSHFQHLKTQKAVYRSVSDDEVVVSRDESNKAEALQGFQGSQVQQIVAFLKGHADTLPDNTALNDIEKTASHADQLAELIMKSAVIDRQAATVEGGETLGDIVVGCLRKTFDTLNQAPGAQTRKGKRAIKKTLTLLEKDLLDRLRETAREGCEQAVEDISAAVEEMTEEVQASDLAAQYVKKRRAAGEDEERLLRFIRRQGPRVLEDHALLKDQLVDEGLSEEGWQELIVRSGIQQPSSPPEQAITGKPSQLSDDTRDVSTLISLLDDLTRAVKQEPNQQASGLMKALEKIGQEVDAAIAQTDEKVEALARFAEMLAHDDMAADALTADPESDRSEQPENRSPSHRLNTAQQRSVMRIMSEITQELSQPLSVIECSLSMLGSMEPEALKASQAPLISLARESVARMDDLIHKIARVTGLPGALYPDHALLDALYSASPSPHNEALPATAIINRA